MNAGSSSVAVSSAKKWDSDDMDGVGVTAVNRALSILEAFTHTGGGQLSLAELAQHTGLYKSTILRLIASLDAFGFISKNPDGKYMLGLAPLKLSAIYQAHVQPSELILATLRTLSKATTESASFYVVNGKQRLCAYRVNSPRSVRDNVQVGQLLPLNKGAAGAVLRAFSGQKGVHLNTVKRDGFALSVGERDSEVAAAATPVFSNGSHLEGALCISGPASRFSDEAVAGMKRVLLEQAKELTLALGGYDLSFQDAITKQGK